MTDPRFTVALYQSQIAAIQQAIQHYLVAKPDTSLRFALETGLDDLDAPLTNAPKRYIHPLLS